ncbi:DUF1628 domain protein [Natrialba magadii ATCC 43099]|uniref:DUF1628 domain protein n=1 Tax=Natrialba magadii (strain ATCC 43099 / DSM 3394 / CCM 3739 / CIP 104546 / IAM 13178 / JCM 8861 / NBRC 102185 / NCIMB 2190 / MS3) TaxID=547559 RepID=D3ST12_NATMM|nr:type IV pilin N-terminal domain-containing protein [Natrialba magadii]ADD04958.1 DUF1628 domain protein [Natrialba magadii ATCC 43099]ELY24006.1 hypothetical protein C500_19420 [Natrialba magadii ATCC 43099]
MCAVRRRPSRRSSALCDPSRAVNPVIGTIALLALTCLLVAVLAVIVSGWSLGGPAPVATFDLSADAETGTLSFEHTAGDPLDVEDLSLHVTVDGTELEYQPPVPFVGAEGFNGSPEGPFNAKSESLWGVGEQASVTIAETNDPVLESGSTVRVVVVVEGTQIGELESVAE